MYLSPRTALSSLATGFLALGAAESRGSIEWLLCMIADLPEHGSPIAESGCSLERNGSVVAKDETVREIGRAACGRRGALREFASQKR
jgi:hypothetical protein